MKILLCNPRNTQGTKHSRKGMYVPLGILSIATSLQEAFGDQVEIRIVDEDIESLDLSLLGESDVVGLYSTTFNYPQALRYAYTAKEAGTITMLGGPHPSILADNILKRRACFDYIMRFEGEHPTVAVIAQLLGNVDAPTLASVPNLSYRANGNIIHTRTAENDLSTLPIPSREFIDFPKYVGNYHSIYPEKKDTVPGSLYSSKGCSWRDKTGGCVFCARLEEGVRFRDISQIWAEIDMLRSEYGVNSVWDIADDNLNNKDWFVEFVESRPKSCKDMRFFIYSRVTPIKPWVIDYFKRLNVEEVFLGVESGDNELLRNSFKGQTREIAFKALKLLSEHEIAFYPSFVLGLPGESEKSMNNTLDMCRDIAQLGGLDRMSATILKPIPGSAAFNKVIAESEYGKDLASMDDIDLTYLERFWADNFTQTNYETIIEYKGKIDKLMSDFHVFGSTVDDKS